MPQELAPARRLGFDNSYARLPERFYARLGPTPVAEPRMLRLNTALAVELGLDPASLSGAEGAALFAGNALPEDAEPIALAYAGHQFGNFVPQLGDGRAVLLGEVVVPDGRRRDIQLKGSGRTPFSRGGDGRASVGPVLREYLVSEAMHALGVPTTRALAAVSTGERVYRETALPGAVLARVGASHIRVGTFQYFAARSDLEAVHVLIDHVIQRHYPELAEAGNRPLALLEAVCEAQARLVAEWMRIGFIHGVMNTDNTALSGETIDYGPCAFVDDYHPGTVFSSIDVTGRYAFANQPKIMQWNLARFAEALLPAIDEDPEAAVPRASEAVNGFAGRFERHWMGTMRRKLGLGTEEEGDDGLIDTLLETMAEAGADYTLTFRRLADAAEGADPGPLRVLFEPVDALDGWLGDWRDRLEREGADPAARAAAMRAANPAVIPRNYRVEEALNAAVYEGDLGPFEAMLAAMARPYDQRPDDDDHARPPGPGEQISATFCGT